MGIREILQRLGGSEPELVEGLDLMDNTELVTHEANWADQASQEVKVAEAQKSRVAHHADQMAKLINSNEVRLDDIRNKIEALRIEEAETVRIIQGLTAAHKVLDAPMVMPKPYHEARMAG